MPTKRTTKKSDAVAQSDAEVRAAARRLGRDLRYVAELVEAHDDLARRVEGIAALHVEGMTGDQLQLAAIAEALRRRLAKSIGDLEDVMERLSPESDPEDLT